MPGYISEGTTVDFWAMMLKIICVVLIFCLMSFISRLKCKNCSMQDPKMNDNKKIGDIIDEP